MTSVDLWIVVPLLILAGGALLVLLLGAFVPGRYGMNVGVVCCAGAALWALQAPPQLMAPTLGLVATPFARFFTIFFALTAGAVLLLSRDYARRHGLQGEEYPATVLFGAFGLAVLAAATNLLIIYLGLEALTFAFYILVAYDRQRPASAEAGLKYLLLGAVSTGFTTFGLALLYAASGSLDLAQALRLTSGDSLALAGWGFLLVGLAFKVSLVPAHLWTPDVYQGAPTPVAAFLAAGSKGGAVAALLLLLANAGDLRQLREPLWGLAVLTMAVGNLAALRQQSLRRLLAYSSIAQMGYVVVALLGGRAGFEAAAFYVVAYGVMILAAFGALAALEGEGRLDLVTDLRGCGYQQPLPAALLALAMFALAGIPPTIGFAGKFAIFFAAIRAGEVALALIGILTAAIAAYYYLRVVVQLYLPEEQVSLSLPCHVDRGETLVLTVCGAAMLLLGLFPDLLFGPVAGIIAALPVR
jgi:NADH-quinone oxidoreductase subunit N